MDITYLKSCLLVAKQTLSIGERNVHEFDLGEDVPKSLRELEQEEQEGWYYSSDIQTLCDEFESNDPKEWKLFFSILADCLSILSDWNLDEVELNEPLPEGFSNTKYDKDENTHSPYLLSRSLKKIGENI